MTIDLTPIILAAITFILGLISTFLIPYLKEKYGAEKLETLKKWVVAGVKAAEQLYAGTGLGELKKDYVVRFLASKGYSVDLKEIDALIEASVFELNNEVK